MNKWGKLRNWLESGAALGHDSYNNVLRYMDALEKEPPKEVFYYSGVPTFDQKAWEKMLEERGIPGLS